MSTLAIGVFVFAFFVAIFSATEFIFKVVKNLPPRYGLAVFHALAISGSAMMGAAMMQALSQ